MLGYRDLARFFYPLRYLMVEQLRAGLFPLWNPYIFGGVPLMGNLQTGLFFPFTILYAFLPFNAAFNYFIIFHYLFAAVFMYYLMRHFEASRYSSFISGLVFAYSGYLLSVSNMLSSLSSVIWLPLIFLFWDKILQAEDKLDIKNCILLALLLGFMFLGGEPTILYITLWFLLFYAVVCYRNRLKNIIILALISLIAILLLSAQVFPFLELLLSSDRANFYNKEMLAFWSLPPREFTNFFLPFSWGNLTRAGGYSQELLGKSTQEWLLSTYIGFIPFVFAVMSVIIAKRKVRFLVLALIASFILAFGKYTPVYYLLIKIPGFSYIRYPVKYAFLSTFLFAFLAGMGIDELFRRIHKGTAKICFIYLGAIAAVFGSFLVLINIFPHKAYNLFFRMTAQPTDVGKVEVLRSIFNFNVGSLINIFIFLFVAIFILFLYQKKFITRKLVLLILGAVILFDLYSINMSLSMAYDPEIYTKVTPNVKLLTNDKTIFRIYSTPSAEVLTRLMYGEDQSDATLQNKDKLSANNLIPHHIFDVFGYESILPADYLRFFTSYRGDSPSKIMKMFNVKYVAHTKPLFDRELKLVKKTKYYFGSIYLYQNLDFWPRAYVVHAARIIKDKKQIPFEMVRKDFDSFREIALEENIPKPLKKKGNTEVRILKYSPLEVILETDIKTPGMLFLSDSYYPGWKAKDNGKPTKIYRANYRLRAVYLDKGKHLVKFYYDPWTFKLGLTISAFMFGFIIIAWKRSKS